MAFSEFLDLKPDNLLEYRNTTEKNWTHFLENPEHSLRVRPFVQASWKRCLTQGLSPLKTQTDTTLASEEVRALLQTSHLYDYAFPVLREMSTHAQYTGYLLTLSDRKGRILYLDGDPQVLRQAAWMNFSVGADWSEEAIGTNAIGTCLALKKPVQIFAAEHFCSGVHDWVCTASPIREPLTNTVLGVIDITGMWDHAQTHTAGFVGTAAKLVEERLYYQSVQTRMQVIDHYLDACRRYPRDGVIAIDATCRLVESNHFAQQFALEKAGLPLSQVWNAEQLHQHILNQQLNQGAPHISDVPLPALDRMAHLYPIPYANRRAGFILVISQQHPLSKLEQKLGPWVHVVGNSPSLLSAIKQGDIVAQSEVPILLQGESGTGKELFAHAIHESGARHAKSFVAVNCGAIPKELIASELFGYEPGTFTGGARSGRKGKFEEAQGGTLFLDEIGELSLEAQVYLLRVLQEKEVIRLGSSRPVTLDVRIVAATHRRLEQQVQEGSFRMDLYYRLNVVTINLPALRDRRDDIPMLIRHALQMLTHKHGKDTPLLSPDVLSFLRDEYLWPGNVRELWNVLEHAILFCHNGIITWTDLPTSFHSYKTKDIFDPLAVEQRHSADNSATCVSIENIHGEREQLSLLLTDSKGNLSELSRRLGVARTTVYRRLRKHGLLDEPS
ncbi:sigma-54-dependent Fis family transcriptional regulator [Alicyclobacillaceae bacterium I2511]|nr:sigma-54-dependent Fis family transcriptional regulator [Alicyclobacillaceae bacterium I2511]